MTAGQAIDLHAHTLRSDGTDTPAALVARAGEAGLTVLALTDHDTTAGWSEAIAATGASATAPTLVPGIELSCRGRAADGGGVGVHLLGYLFDRDHAEFADERARLRRERVTRLRTMAESMAADGLPIDPDRVCAEAGPAGGRPHLARALVEAGVVPTISDAFTRLLAPGGPYHRRRRDVDLVRGIGLITAAGGVAVLAHPAAGGRGRTVDPAGLGALVDAGLAGIEVDHPEHDEAARRRLRGLAFRHGLIVTGSSDYHGDNKPNRLGQCVTAPDQYARLLGRATGGAPIPPAAPAAEAGR